MALLPEGWTDDLSVALPAGVALEEIVDAVLSGNAKGTSSKTQLEALRSFGLALDDAELALDRVLAGVARARTTSPVNEPSAEKDPIAHLSYWRCRSNPSLLSAMLPNRTPGDER